MTDGVQRVFGIEYRPITELRVLSPAGMKIVVCNVHIRRGLLLLVPQAVVTLGGIVEELDLARQRLVNEVNNPPRGRSRTGDPIPLATRATNAAWNSQNNVGVSTPSELTESNNTTRATNPIFNSSNIVHIFSVSSLE